MTMTESSILNEYRCDCGKLLFKGVLSVCRVEIKCKRCGAIKVIICGNDYLYGRAGSRLNRCSFLSDIDCEGNFISIDAEMTSLLGYEAGEVIGKSLFDLCVLEEGDLERDKFLSFAEKGKPFVALNANILRKDGNTVILPICFVPVEDRDKPSGYKLVSWAG